MSRYAETETEMPETNQDSCQEVSHAAHGGPTTCGTSPVLCSNARASLPALVCSAHLCSCQLISLAAHAPNARQQQPEWHSNSYPVARVCALCESGCCMCRLICTRMHTSSVASPASTPSFERSSSSADLFPVKHNEYLSACKGNTALAQPALACNLPLACTHYSYCKENSVLNSVLNMHHNCARAV